jgi:hypothetical protein
VRVGERFQAAQFATSGSLKFLDDTHMEIEISKPETLEVYISDGKLTTKDNYGKKFEWERAK